jgi:hypothetical protein
VSILEVWGSERRKESRNAEMLRSATLEAVCPMDPGRANTM